MKRWVVRYMHDKESASWWGETVQRAETAEEAAGQLKDLIEEHARHGEPLKVVVYGPVPDERREFRLQPSVTVEEVQKA